MRKFLSTVTWLFSTLLGVFLVVFAPYSWGCTETPHLVTDIVFIPNTNKLLIVHNYGTDIQIWDKEGDQPERHLNNLVMHGGEVLDVIFSADGTRIYSTSRDFIFKVWDAHTGDLLDSFTRPYHNAATAVFSPDGNYVVTIDGNSVATMWNVDMKTAMYTINTDVDQIVFSSDSKSFLTYWKRGHHTREAIWNVLSGTSLQEDVTAWSDKLKNRGLYQLQIDNKKHILLKNQKSNEDIIVPIDYNPILQPDVMLVGDRYCIITELYSGYVLVRVWDIATRQLKPTLVMDEYPRTKLAVSPTKAKIVHGYYNGMLILWDIDTGQKLPIFDQYVGSLDSLEISPDGQYLLVNTYDTAHLWAIATGKDLRRFSGIQHMLRTTMSPDQRLLLTIHLDKIVLWDVDSGQILNMLSIRSIGDSRAGFSPNSQLMLVEDSIKRFTLRNTANFRVLQTIPNYWGISDFDFSNDGKFVVVVTRGGTFVWDIANERVLYKLIYPEIAHASFSPDNQYILTHSVRHMFSPFEIILWNTKSMQFRTFEGNVGGLDSTFSPDGKQILTITGRNTVVLWDTATLKPIRSRCPRMVNNTGQAVGLGLCLASIMALALNIWCVRRAA